MEFDVDSLAAMASDIWSAMLGMDLAPGNGAMSKLGESPTLVSYVQISGDWAGAVTVACPTELAKRFAGAMFACDPNDLAIDEVKDALGELSNMTGGSIKGMVPGDCQLGIPAVVEGEHLTVTIPKGHETARVDFEMDGEPLQIIVFEAE
ncbi:MAG: chemotaxis protein CheX [Acidimicrobiia bacterium]|jgi:chemotaxis protein CheX